MTPVEPATSVGERSGTVGSLLSRWCACLVAHVLVRSVLVSHDVGRWLLRSNSLRHSSDAKRIVVTGRFLADGWVRAHAVPLAQAASCEHLWIVSDERMGAVENATYVCPPRWLRMMAGSAGSRGLVLIWVALRRRVHVVGGFHLLCNGLLALGLAPWVRARAMYFCVGGVTEVVDGGARGENRLFNKTGGGQPGLERLLACAVRRFDLLLTMGHGAKRFLEELGVSSTIAVMSGGIDPSLFSSASQEKTYDLITVSRIVPVKRHDVFLDVVARVKRELPTLRTVVVGDGPDLESIRSLAGELGVADCVEFAGRQSDMPRYLAGARLFVLTSDSEGLSLALMEAMMAGLPAVVSDVGDLGDIVENGVSGYLVARRDAAAFADQIVALLTEPTLLDAFASKAREAAMPYAVGEMRKRWERLLSDSEDAVCVTTMSA